MEAFGLYGVSVRFAEIILFRYPRRSQCMHGKPNPVERFGPTRGFQFLSLSKSKY